MSILVLVFHDCFSCGHHNLIKFYAVNLMNQVNWIFEIREMKFVKNIPYFSTTNMNTKAMSFKK
jgi:hypothetical protein